MLMRTDPFRELDRLTQQVLGTAARPASVPMDAYRKGDSFFVHVDLPGVNADDVEMTVEKNVLTIRAERRSSAPEDAEFVVAERPQGAVTRQLFLGESLDTENISASYDAGVLTLAIPVAEPARPRRISISTGAGGSGQQSIASGDEEQKGERKQDGHKVLEGSLA